MHTTTTTIIPVELDRITGGYDWGRTYGEAKATSRRWSQNGGHYGSYLGPIGRGIGQFGGWELGAYWGAGKDAYRQLTNKPQQP